jgi:hypothetical protein
MLRSTLLLLAAFFYTSPALAAWGDNWGVMVWGAAAPSAVPMMDGLGLGLLALVLIGLAIRGLRSRATLGLMVLASFVGAADLAEAQGVTVPNTFTNGQVADATQVNENFAALTTALDVTVPNSFANSGIADANQVNSNFTALKIAVDTFTNDLAAATSATETAFTNGFLEAEDSIDITIDNAAAEAVAAAAAGSAACTQAGGTWDAGTSTCTPAAAPYNCFIGGFCSQAAIDFPPATFGYTNVYDGHTQTTEPALGAGCNVSPASFEWADGSALLINGLSLSLTSTIRTTSFMCQ